MSGNLSEERPRKDRGELRPRKLDGKETRNPQSDVDGRPSCRDENGRDPLLEALARAHSEHDKR